MFAALDADKIARASGDGGVGRHERAQERQGRLASGRARREPPRPTPKCPASRRRCHSSRSSASSTRTRPASTTTASARPASKSISRPTGDKDFSRLLIGQKSPTGGNLFAKQERRQARLSDSRVSGADLQQGHVRSPRQSGPSLRSGQGRPHRDRRRRQDPRDRQERQRLESHEADSGDVGLRRRRRDCSARCMGAQMKSVAAENASPADLKKYGLDKPTATLTLGLGSAKATLSLGGKADGGDAVRPRCVQAPRHDARELAGRRSRQGRQRLPPQGSLRLPRVRCEPHRDHARQSDRSRSTR